MNSNSSKSPFLPGRVSKSEVVVQFEFDPQIVLKLGNNLLELAKSLKGELVTPNLPDAAPPDTPRTVIKAKDVAVAISHVRAQASLEPPQHVASDVDGALSFLAARAGDILSILKDRVSYEWSGIILDIDFPAETTERGALELMEPFFDHMLNMNRDDRKLGSFELKVGFTERGFHRNFLVNGLETRQYSFEARPDGQRMRVDVESKPISEVAAHIRVDINNKPKASHGDYVTELSELWEEYRSTLKNLRTELGMEGLLS